MEDKRKKCLEIAERIYDLDLEVYRCVGSSLGRAFSEERKICVENLAELMMIRPQGHLLRSELALISNMARTIKNKEEKSKVMTEYDAILKEVAALPDTFGQVDIINEERAKLNTANLHQKFKDDDHLVICIGRTQGSAGNDIGFELADKLHINYYDSEIFEQVLKRQEEEKFHIKEKECFTEFDKYGKKRETLKSKLRNMYRYHGLNREDAVFFNMSDLICNLARTEDCIIVGRCADIILRNNYIPHISLFISAPFEVRLQYMMNVREMDQKTAVKFLKKMDRQHKKYYEFYTSEKWGTPENYDLCINSANYGIKETIEIIERLIINRKKA